MAKNQYEVVQDAIKNKLDKSNQSRGRVSTAVSKTDMEELAHTLLNTPEHTTRIYNSKDGAPVYEERTPVTRYRESMKPMLRALGLDKSDSERAMDVQISKEHAAAMMEVSTVVVHDYLAAGRKFSMPIMDENETKMEFYASIAPERESVNRFAKGDAPVTITQERTILKVKNTVPAWMKSKK